MSNESVGREFEGNSSDEEGLDFIPMEMDLTVNGPPPPDDDRSVDSKQFKETCGSKMYHFAKVFLPHFGLVLLLGVYTVCGAGIFHIIELPNEIQVRKEALTNIKKDTNDLLERMWNMSLLANITREEWLFEANEDLRQLKRLLHDAHENKYVNLDDILNENIGNSSRTNVWEIPQAIFFATTVITTIGYGNVVPKTTSGKILCIVFGLFGIPLLLITIADIGKFLSDFMKFLYRSYRRFKNQIKRQSRRLSTFRRKVSKKTSKDNTEGDSEEEMRLPWIMVMLVLITYAALGALLFHVWETWDYFDAFYFCFITMATVGFGDIVPKQQTFMFFTIAYILIGLALTTMCIDLAGTEYIEKIHYFGQKMDVAKDVVSGAVVSGLHAGLHAGGELLKHTSYGLVKTSTGKVVAIGDTMILTTAQAEALRKKYNLPPDYDFGGRVIGDGMTEAEFLAKHPEIMSRRRHGLMAPLTHNIIYEPISEEVLKVMKPNVKLRLDEIKESDAFILENKMFNRPLEDTLQKSNGRGSTQRNKYRIRSNTWPKKVTDNLFLIAPFLLKESKV